MAHLVLAAVLNFERLLVDGAVRGHPVEAVLVLIARHVGVLCVALEPTGLDCCGGIALALRERLGVRV